MATNTVPILIETCPHCRARKISFAFIAEDMKKIEYADHWSTFWVCPNCKDPILFVLEPRTETGAQQNPSQFSSSLLVHFTIIQTYPDSSRLLAPDDVPDNIASTYTEAVQCLDHQGWTSAGLMFRKVLELATLQIGPDCEAFRKKILYNRIEQLAGTNLLPSTMQQLAHEIRLSGNIAAHEQEYDKEEAEQLQEFAELFLIYLFTLPRKIERSRVKQEASEEI